MTFPIISADSHITEPPGTYVDRIDARFREKAPRILPKRKLTVFWTERNLHRKAGALLSDDLRPVAPQ